MTVGDGGGNGPINLGALGQGIRSGFTAVFWMVYIKVDRHMDLGRLSGPKSRLTLLGRQSLLQLNFMAIITLIRTVLVAAVVGSKNTVN